MLVMFYRTEGRHLYKQAVKLGSDGFILTINQREPEQKFEWKPVGFR